MDGVPVHDVPEDDLCVKAAIEALFPEDRSPEMDDLDQSWWAELFE